MNIFQNNPVLISEAGVGKTAIVEGIAQRIVEGDVTESSKINADTEGDKILFDIISILSKKIIG